MGPVAVATLAAGTWLAGMVANAPDHRPDLDAWLFLVPLAGLVLGVVVPVIMMAVSKRPWKWVLSLPLLVVLVVGLTPVAGRVAEIVRLQAGMTRYRLLIPVWPDATGCRCAVLADWMRGLAGGPEIYLLYDDRGNRLSGPESPLASVLNPRERAAMAAACVGRSRPIIGRFYRCSID